MAKKSEDAVIEALLKDETQYSDMIDIMKFMQDCLGKDFPEDGRVLSMGDLVNDKLVLRGTLWMATHHEKDFNCWSHSVQIGTFNCAYCVWFGRHCIVSHPEIMALLDTSRVC